MKKKLFLFVAALCFGSWATAGNLTFEKVGDFAWVNKGAIVAIDINGDGYQSVLYMERADDKRSVYLANNKGTLTKYEYGKEEGLKDLGIAFHENPGMVVMDVNKDGKQDVVVAGGWPPAVNVYLNNGEGGFTKDDKQTNLIGARDYDNSDYLAAGDYDNDGWEDLFVLGLTNEDKALQLSIYRNNNGVFELAQSLEGCRGGSIAVGDVNGDGNLDVFYNGYGEGYVTNLYYGDGKGNWTKAEGIDFVKSNKGDVAIIDFNGDGKMDLLEQSREVQNTTIYCNNGDGTFTKKSNEETGLPKRDDLFISYGDFNVDGKMDIIASHWSITATGGCTALFLNNGDFTFTKVDLENEARDGGVFAWDYDNDKKCDYMVWQYSDIKSWNAPIVRNTTVIEEPTPEEPTYEVFEEEITDLVVDVDAMTISGGPSANYMVKVILGLGDYDRNEGTYQLLPESYVSIQGTDATFVDGYVAELDAFTPSAKAVVRCVWNGMNVELHLNMSAAPMEATVVVVENATAKVEKYLIFGDEYEHRLKITGEWLNPEDGVTYPVLVEVPVYYPESTEPSEILSTVTVGGWGDNDPWLGFGEGTLTITTVGDVVTATGVVQNPMAGVAIDITITGKISTGHTVTIVTLPEGAGVVTGAGEYEDGAEVTVTAEENEGWYFMGWYDATTSILLAEDYEYTFQALGDVNLIAYFIPALEGMATDLVIGENTLTASAVLSIGTLNMNLVLGEEEEGAYWLAETSTLSIDGNEAILLEGMAAVNPETQMAAAEMLVMYNEELYYIAVLMIAPETGVDNIQVENVAVKMIKNGQLIIIKNGVEYNVQGAKL